jgi:hypothetical protein
MLAFAITRFTTQVAKAAGIAPASRIPQADTPHDSCANTTLTCLHTACTGFALRELVSSWHRVTPDVRERIVAIVRRHPERSLSADLDEAGISRSGIGQTLTLELGEFSLVASSRPSGANLWPPACRDIVG